MIDAHSLHTAQIDFPDQAVAEIQQQLGAVQLRKNSAGILICHYDFVQSGAVAALCRALSFPVVGYTTLNQATQAVCGPFELTLTVLTSDDVEFSAAAASGTDVAAVYGKACAGRTQPPTLVFGFIAMQAALGGDEFIHRLNAASGGVPIFGALSAGEDDLEDSGQVLCGDNTLSDGFALLHLYGPVQARFYYGNHPQQKLLEYSARVTSMDGTLLKELDGRPALELLKKNGFLPGEDARKGLLSMPFLFRPAGEEMLISRTMADYTDEGWCRLFGQIPDDATFFCGTTTMQDLLNISRQTVQQAVDESPNAALLVAFSCVGRYISLGLDITSELDCAAEPIQKDMPFLMAYAGGELCPAMGVQGMQNQFHNSSFIVCTLG